MKIAYCSDLHIEFDEESRLINLLSNVHIDTDILVLAGDIHTGEHIVRILNDIHKAMPNIHIVYVTGNHEFYDFSIVEIESNLRTTFKNHTYIHFLEKDIFELNNIVFLGTTLWTGFDAYPEYEQARSEENAMRGVADFKYIKDDHGLFQSHHCKTYYQKNITWLDQSLTKNSHKTCLIVTHFPPLPLLEHKQIPINSLSNYFQADCSAILEKHQPSYWIYGHNHWSLEKRINNTQFLSCQAGYPDENCNTKSLLSYFEVSDEQEDQQ